MEIGIEILGEFKEIAACKGTAHTPKEASLIMSLGKGNVPKLKSKTTFAEFRKTKIRPGEFYILNQESGCLIFTNEVSIGISNPILTVEVIHSSFNFSLFKDNKMIRSVQCIQPDESFDGKLYYTETGIPLEEEAGFDQNDPAKVIPLIQSISGIDIRTLSEESEMLLFRAK